MPVKGQIESIDNGVTIFQDLHKLSVGKMNYERSMANAKHKEFYTNEWNEMKPMWEQYKRKIFTVNEDGKMKKYNGEELVLRITKQRSDFLDNIYKGLIAPHDKNGSRIDWLKIDKEQKYGKLDDLIIYDKWGRFDLENFQKKENNG